MSTTTACEFRAPSMRYLLQAERENDRLGHTNLGYLSLSHGFMPKNEPLKSLPKTFELWDNLCAQTPELIKNLSFRNQADNMEVLIPNAQALPEKYLERASMLLGFFAHAYANCAGELLTQDDVPDAIMIPWKIISERLHRPETFLSYFDLIAYNWKYKAPHLKNKTLENMDLLYPIFNCAEESNLYLIQTEMMVNASPMVGAVAYAQEAVFQKDDTLLTKSLDTIIDCLKQITHVSFAKLAYHKRSDSYMDPVVFTKTMMSFAVPIKENIPGPSGTSFPYAHLMDIFLGRKKYDEGISKEALKIRSLYPPHIKKFLETVATVSVKEYIQNAASPDLKAKYMDLVAAYSGENGFLNAHRKRVYSFIQTSFKVGRPQTIGGFNGENEDEWDAVNTALLNMQNERPKCPFASVENSEQQRNQPSKKSTEIIPDKRFSLSSLAKHSTEENGYWALWNNNILDITRYIKKHPGGETALFEFVGSNMTKEFYRMHADNIIAEKIAEKLIIGQLTEPVFLSEPLAQLWEAQKQLLWKIVELYNVYLLEVDMKNKACFPNNDDRQPNAYKAFLIKNSDKRYSSSYKAKLVAHAANLTQWMDEYRPLWNQTCPFSSISKRFKRKKSDATQADQKLKDNLANFLDLKETAIQLSLLLEQENASATNVSEKCGALVKKILLTIRTIH